MTQLFAAYLRSGFDFENLGVGRLKSFIEQNNEQIQVTYLDINDNIENNMQSVILENKLFGFSMYNDNMEFFVNIINEIKRLKPDAIIVVGSKFVSLYYKEILGKFDNIDLAILGDGEKALLYLIKSINKNNDIELISLKHENIASKRNADEKHPAILNIKELPWPDRSWMKEIKNKYHYHALICDSQGCTGTCSFCTRNNYYTKWSGRFPEDIYNEIIEINNEFGVRWFFFTSSSFEDSGTAGKEKIKKLCLLLKENNKNFSFSCYLRANTFKNTNEDIKLLKLMRSSGFKLVIVGIESGNEEDLIIYNKHTSVDENKLTLKLLTEAGIYAQTIGFIMLNPYTTRTKLTLNYKFLCEFGIGSIARFVKKLRVHTQTEIYDRVKKDGLITCEGSYNQIGECLYEFNQPDIEDIDVFISKYLDTAQIKKINADLETSTNFIISYYEFVENGEQYKIKMMEIEQRNSELLAEYFFYLYVEFDLIKSKKLLSDMINEYSKNANEIRTLQLGLYKKLNKQL